MLVRSSATTCCKTTSLGAAILDLPPDVCSAKDRRPHRAWTLVAASAYCALVMDLVRRARLIEVFDQRIKR